MAGFGLGLDELWADDITHAVRDEDGGGHEAFLGLASDIRHADGDDQAHDGAEEADDGVAGDGGRGVVMPRAPPDEGAAGKDGQTAEHQQDDANVRDAAAEVARQQDEDEADAAERELEEDGVQRRVAEGADDERAEAADGPVHRVCGCHQQEHEQDLDVEDGFADLRPFECHAPDSRLAVSQAFSGNDALLGSQEPCGHGRAGDGEAEEPEDEGE